MDAKPEQAAVPLIEREPAGGRTPDADRGQKTGSSSERSDDSAPGRGGKTLDPAMQSLTAKLAQEVTDPLLRPDHQWAAGLSERVDRLASELVQAVSWLLSGGNGAPGPANGPRAPPEPHAPGAPPPAVPVPAGSSPASGSFFFGGAAPFGGSSGGSLANFGAWETFSTSLLQGGKASWPSGDLLRPSSAPRPTIERPG